MALPNDTEDLLHLEIRFTVTPIVASAVREILRVGNRLHMVPNTEKKHRPTYLVSRQDYLDALEQFLEKVPGVRNQQAKSNPTKTNATPVKQRALPVHCPAGREGQNR